jgi:hypothetical protein
VRQVRRARTGSRWGRGHAAAESRWGRRSAPAGRHAHTSSGGWPSHFELAPGRGGRGCPPCVVLCGRTTKTGRERPPLPHPRTRPRPRSERHARSSPEGPTQRHVTLAVSHRRTPAAAREQYEAGAEPVQGLWEARRMAHSRRSPCSSSAVAVIARAAPRRDRTRCGRTSSSRPENMAETAAAHRRRRRSPVGGGETEHAATERATS